MAYITRTTGTPTDRKKFTYSAWLKLANIETYQRPIQNYVDGSNRGYILYTNTADSANNTWFFYDRITSQINFQANSVAKYRDTNGFYHLVVRADTTQSTQADRYRVYVNGEQISLSIATNIGQNVDLGFNSPSANLRIGGQESGSETWKGIMSHVHFCDGYSYAPTEFGSTDATTGEWKINTSPSVTYGNNGYFVFKDDNAVTDRSGQGNNFTLSGSITKTEDCPSNVFATMNPLDNGQSGTTILLANGNNTFMANSGSGDLGLKSTLGANSGKYYWEFKDMGQGQTCGTAEMDMRIVINKNGGAGLVGGQNWTVQRYSSSEMNIYNNGTYSRVSTLWGGSNSGDIYSIALDCDNGKIFMQKNGGGYKDLSGNTGDPVNGTNPTFSGLATDGSKYYGAWTENRGNVDNSCHYNFGNGYFGTTAISSAGTNASGIGIFEYDVPTGFTALSTKGLNL